MSTIWTDLSINDKRFEENRSNNFVILNLINDVQLQAEGI